MSSVGCSTVAEGSSCQCRPFLISMTALHCGTHLVRDTVMWLSGCLRVAGTSWQGPRGRDLSQKATLEGHEMTPPLEMARDQNQTEVVSLLERFLANPLQTCHDAGAEARLAGRAGCYVLCLDGFFCATIFFSSRQCPATQITVLLFGSLILQEDCPWSCK